MKVLIHLIGGQNAPNFIASKIIQPDLNILVYSDGSVSQKNALKKILSDTKTQGELVGAYDYKNCTEKCNEIISKFGISDELILNFTGGTKIMAASFLSVFNNKNLLSVYINSEENKILYLKGGEFENKDLKINFNIDEYLRLYGHSFRIKDNIKPYAEPYQKYLKFISEKFNIFSEFITDIHKKTYKKKLNSIPESISKGESIFSFDKKNKKLKLFFRKSSKKIEEEFEFDNVTENDLKFILSGWFEQYIFTELNKLNYFEELKMNIEINFKDKEIKNKTINEIDIIGIKNNKIIIIEIKSGNYNQDNINKLKAIKENLGGTYSIPVFITYFPATPDALNRIDEYGFKNFTHKEIKKCIDYIESLSAKSINL